MLLLHVLGATIWTGGHLVLSLVILPPVLRDRDVAALQRFESGYERLGIPALVIQVITGLYLAHHYLSPSLWFSFESRAATLIAVKLLLLAATVGLAIHARLRLIPRLSPDNLRTLAYHIVAVTVIAVLFVVVGVSFRTGVFF